MAEKHCRHTYSDIVKEALKIKDRGPAANRPNSTNRTAITIPGTNQNDYRDKINS